MLYVSLLVTCFDLIPVPHGGDNLSLLTKPSYIHPPAGGNLHIKFPDVTL